MIRLTDLDAAIAECQGKRNPDSKTCIMLAAFYTIKREMYGETGETVHSYAPAPNRNIIEIYSDSEFSRAVDGKPPEDIMPVLDELMSTLQVIHPRLYNAVMEKLS